MINIVLFEPEEAPNTGNIGRTCVCIGARLHLIEPLGFQLTDKKIRRAGLDYWGRLDVTRYMDYNDFMERNPGAEVYYATTKARYRYSDVQYKDNVFIMFGKESAGIPEEILVQHPDHPHSHEAGGTLPESVQCRIHRGLRGHAADGLPGAGGQRESAPSQLG